MQIFKVHMFTTTFLPLDGQVFCKAHHRCLGSLYSPWRRQMSDPLYLHHLVASSSLLQYKPS